MKSTPGLYNEYRRMYYNPMTTTTTTDLDVEIKEAETQLEGWTDKVRALREAGASRRDIRLAQGAVNTWDERLIELRQKEKNS